MLSLLSILGRLYYSAFGTKNFTSLERMSLDAWRHALSPDVQAILEAQLEAALFFQRQAKGAKLCVYYPASGDIPTFSDVRPDLLAATVTINDALKPSATMEVKIFLHRGHFFSIEFPKRPNRYLQLHGMRLENVQVARVVTRVALNQ